jgi:hypothetical protein
MAISDVRRPLTFNQEVMGSNPIALTNKSRGYVMAGLRAFVSCPRSVRIQTSLQRGIA